MGFELKKFYNNAILQNIFSCFSLILIKMFDNVFEAKWLVVFHKIKLEMFNAGFTTNIKEKFFIKPQDITFLKDIKLRA